MTAGHPARHSLRASPALQRLADDDPAIAALALWCEHRDDDGPRAAWTDGRTVFYGAAFEGLAPHEQAGLAAHQVLHVAFRHAPRGAALRSALGAGFAGDLFNIASDALLNEILLEAGHGLPRPALRLRDLLAALPDPAPARLAAWDVERLYRHLADTEGRRAGPARAHAETQRFAGDLELAPGPGDAGDTDAAVEWQARLARALALGRAAGRGIGAAAVTLGDLPVVRTRWQGVLRGLLLRALAVPPRLGWARPARRWIARDDAARAAGEVAPAFEPGMIRPPGRAVLALCLDCSSSVERAMLAAFAAQVAAILRQTGAEAHLILFDEAVRGQHRLERPGIAAQIGRLAFARDGGTDFAPALAAAAALAPSAVVVLTDLDADLPPRPTLPRGAPLIWAVPAAPTVAPDWGRVVVID